MGQKVFHAIGLMSGSSLDGLDIAYVQFINDDGQWSFTILQTECIEYPPQLLHKLRTAKQLSIEEFYRVHTQLGHYFGSAIKNFCSTYQIVQVDVVTSHGHTIFHDPENMCTCQIGCGAAIAASSGFKTVSDLRAIDIAYRGQGAPIVPIGDRLLFSSYDAWLNIGGIANITILQNSNYTAFDIASGNQIINHYANKLGKKYDDRGGIAARSKIHAAIINELCELPYYLEKAPKSLDNSFSQIIIDLLDQHEISVEDKIATYTEHLAQQIALSTKECRKLLATGGGAHNTFLIERIQFHSNAEIVLPSIEIIDYKEALVMALIGVLRTEHQTNVLMSATGAIKDSISGAVYLP